jgi:hypothetical protein
LLQLFCDKCKAGNIRKATAIDWGLLPTSTQGYPNTVASAKDALKESEFVQKVSDIGGIVTGVGAAELAEKVAEMSKGAADAGTGNGMTKGWVEKMTEVLEEIQNHYAEREGVYIDVLVSWEKCEQVRFLQNVGGGIPGTSHLDWVAHSSWYINKEAGTSGIQGDGFDSKDTAGISKAIFPSVVAALQNTAY